MYAKAVAAIVIALALAALFWKGVTVGEKRVQAEWDADVARRTSEALAASEQARAKEQELQTKARKIDVAYQAEKSRRAAADAAFAGLRDQLTAALDRAASEDPKPPNGVDGADPRPAIAGECLGQLVALESAYGGLVSKARALQDFTRDVCVTPE